MTDELARAARELLAAASDPIRFPTSEIGDETVSMVPTPCLNELRHALDALPPTRQQAAEAGGL